MTKGKAKGLRSMRLTENEARLIEHMRSGTFAEAMIPIQGHAYRVTKIAGPVDREGHSER